MRNIIAIITISTIALFILFIPTFAVINPQSAPFAEESLEGIDFNLQASNTDVHTRGLFHNGIAYILASNPNNVPKMVVVNPQIGDWNMQGVQIKYGNLEIKKIWNLLQISVPAFQSGLIIIQPSDIEEKSSTGYNYPVKTLNIEERPSAEQYYPRNVLAREEKTSTGYNYPREMLAREEIPSAAHYYPRNALASQEKTSAKYNYPKETLAREEIPSAAHYYPRNELAREEKTSAKYSYPKETLASEDIPPTGHYYTRNTLAREEKTLAKYNYPVDGHRPLWETSIIKVDAYGQLTVDGLSGVDYDLQSSNIEVLTRGLFYNGIEYILIANPYDIPKMVVVKPQKSNWYIQNLLVKYGTLMVSKAGNRLHITVPGYQSALIIITPQKKRYSFTAEPKPAYSFRAGPKPRYSFQAGPKPSYSFRIGY